MPGMDKIKQEPIMGSLLYLTLLTIMLTTPLSILSYNSGGLGNTKREMVRDMLTDTAPDILLLQETWLLKRDIQILSNIHDDYLANGKSSVSDDEILQGRPYGGLGILWKKSLSMSIKPISVECDRVHGALVTLADGSVILLLNVYLPVDLRHANRVNEDYELCIDAIETCLHEQNYNSVVIGGDMNTDFSRNNAQSQCLEHFLHRNSMQCTWRLPCAESNMSNGTDVYTFKTADGHTSCIDRYIIPCKDISAVGHVSVLDYIATCCDWGHCPILMEMKLGMKTQQNTTARQGGGVRFAWHRISGYDEYKKVITDVLSNTPEICNISTIVCNDRNCRDPQHLAEIDMLCRILTDICLHAAELTLPTVERRRVIPNWNEEIKPLKEVANFWGNIWKECGRPSDGIVLDM